MEYNHNFGRLALFKKQKVYISIKIDKLKRFDYTFNQYSQKPLGFIMIKRTFILFMILLFTTLTSCKKEQNMKNDKLTDFIGVLKLNKPLTYKNPSELALEDNFIYKTSDYTLSRLYIHSSKDINFRDYEGKTVKIKGFLKKDLNNLIKKKEKAPDNYGKVESLAQMRSDWVSDFTGFEIGKSTKEKLKNINYIEAFEIEEFKAFNIEFNDSESTVTFENIFDFEINNLLIVGHYETRSYGKPQPRFIEENIELINPGGKKKVSFKRDLLETDRDKDIKFTLESIDIFLNKEYLKINYSFYL